VDDSAGLDFDANLELLVDLGSGYTAINPIPNSGGSTVSSVSGAFYSVVPEPSTALLFACGLIGLAQRRNRVAS
jgi:hypothetical protein